MLRVHTTHLLNLNLQAFRFMLLLVQDRRLCEPPFPDSDLYTALTKGSNMYALAAFSLLPLFAI